MSRPRWEPLLPCRSEVLAVIRMIRDSLEASRLLHVTEQCVDENADLFACACHDATGHVNLGYVGWSDRDGRVAYAAHKPEVENHDTAEGVAPEESLCWWTPDSAEAMVLHLNGGVRAMIERARAMARWREAAAGTETESTAA